MINGNITKKQIYNKTALLIFKRERDKIFNKYKAAVS